MGRPRRTDGTKPTRDRIIQAATELFAEHGYQGTSLAAIAQRASIKAPSLLYHFGSKDGLYEEVVRAFYDELRSSWQDVLEQGAGPQQLLAALGRLRDLEQTKRDLLVTVVTELMRDGRAAAVIEEAIVPLMDRLVSGLEQVIGPEQPTRQIIALLVVAFVMNIDASRSLPEVDRLRAALWGDGDRLEELALRLLRPSVSADR